MRVRSAFQAVGRKGGAGRPGGGGKSAGEVLNPRDSKRARRVSLLGFGVARPRGSRVQEITRRLSKAGTWKSWRCLLLWGSRGCRVGDRGGEGTRRATARIGRGSGPKDSGPLMRSGPPRWGGGPLRKITGFAQTTRRAHLAPGRDWFRHNRGHGMSDIHEPACAVGEFGSSRETLTLTGYEVGYGPPSERPFSVANVPVLSIQFDRYPEKNARGERRARGQEVKIRDAVAYRAHADWTRDP